MKKIFSIILVLVLSLGICACTNEKSDEINPVGKYKNIGIFANEEYTLKEDLTFTSTDSTKGTYVHNTDGTIWFSRGDELGFDFVKQGDYYYKKGEGECACFAHDTSENLSEVMFDENYRSNQSFQNNIGTTYYILELKEDGTYYAALELYEDAGDKYDFVSKKEFKGKYSFKNSILWLTHGKDKYPMIYDAGVLYFDVIQKVEK